jgi:hypothetical protein
MDSCTRRFVRLTEQCANGFFREIRQRFVDTFKATGDGDAVLLAPALVGLAWEMVTVADGTVAGSGYDVLVLDDDGRILLDHQHILS